MSRFITAKEQNKLIRQDLKAVFPGVKFSVRSSNGSATYVSWTDGPTREQVEKVADKYRGGYFDGMTDYRGGYESELNGEPVHFSNDFIFCERSVSDEALAAAIDAVYEKYRGNFENNSQDKPTLEQYKNGSLYRIQFPRLHLYGDQSVQADINKQLSETSYFEPKGEAVNSVSVVRAY